MGGCAFPGGPRSVVATQYDGSGHNGNGCDSACSSGHMPPAKPRLPSNLGHPVRRGHAGMAEMVGTPLRPVIPGCRATWATLLLTEDESGDNRYIAAWALGAVGAPSALPALQHAAASDDGTDREGRPVRDAALEAIDLILSRK
jgi:hypothetical protein